jgi:ferredoxin/flavodoxin
MRVRIYYLSLTGNTKLICELIKKGIKYCDVEIYPISTVNEMIIEKDLIIGFACFTDQLGIPKIMKEFIEKNKTTRKNYAFIINTYGSISGRTLYDLYKYATKSRYVVIEGISIHVPENYPPMIKKGFAFENEPSIKELERIEIFLSNIQRKIIQIDNNQLRKSDYYKIERKQQLMPILPKVLSKFELGKMECIENKCTKCRICEKGCPVGAIEIKAFPTFDIKLCQNCWKCYNLCPNEALRGSKFGNGYRYNTINKDFKEKIISLYGKKI